MALFWKRKDLPEASKTEVPASVDEPIDRDARDEDPQSSDPVAPSDANEALQDEETSSATASPKGLFGRMREALARRIQRTRDDIVGQIRAAVKAAGKVDEDLLERIEEILVKADVGAETTMRIIDRMREFEGRGASPDQLLASFKEQLREILGRNERTLARPAAKPCVILVVGVNGVGKTTTIGKLAAEFRQSGLRTMVVAGDTFRAAAIEQLEIWAKRTGSAFVSRAMGADPAGIAFDAVQQAADQQFDMVLVDTAGRLHTKSNLMEELKKIVRVVDKVMPGAPHEVLLVLDATTGQNAISQARVFTEAIPITGLVMTKLDGTAKGGVLIGIRNLFDVPVVKIGVGESVEDLRDFDPVEFVDALFEE
jgi:fused signal recognition particle receptor